jgi:hypothetical protein
MKERTMSDRPANGSKSSGLTKIGKGRDMFLLFVKGRHASLPTEDSAKTSRWTKTVFLIVFCLVAFVIVVVIWQFLSAKN